METGLFYFLNDEYFKKFAGNNLMDNKEKEDGKPHNRPCYYAFKENDSGIFWMIPISSQVDKYQNIYNQRIIKYPDYDGIQFGYVLGKKCAFLIQNMCPVTEKYITNIYIDNATKKPVLISEKLKKNLNARARKAVRLSRKGIKIVFPNILEIEKQLF